MSTYSKHGTEQKGRFSTAANQHSDEHAHILMCLNAVIVRDKTLDHINLSMTRNKRNIVMKLAKYLIVGPPSFLVFSFDGVLLTVL